MTRTWTAAQGLLAVFPSIGQTPSGAPLSADPTFARVSCAEPTAEAQVVRALFELSGVAGSVAMAFFASPWPGDIRLADGRPNLQGSPTPGIGVLGTDPLQPHVGAVEEDACGWGVVHLSPTSALASGDAAA